MRGIAVWACVLLLVLLFSPFGAAHDGWQAQFLSSQPGALSRADNPYTDEMLMVAFVEFNSEAIRQSLLPLRCLFLLSAYFLLHFTVKRVPYALRMINHRTRHMLACKTCHPQLAPPNF